MAEIFVRTTGNDTTGNGSTGTPYATLKKALSVAVAGDVILMGTGTYAEDSGAGSLQLSVNPTNYVYVVPESGNLGDVIVTNVSGTYVLLVAACSFLQFQGIVFHAKDSTVIGVVRFLGANANHLRFVECRFEVLGSSSQTNSGIVSAWTSGSFTVSDVAFTGCEIRQVGAYAVAGFAMDNQTGTVTNFQLVGMKAHVGSFAVRLKGMARLQLHDLDLLSFSPAVAGTCLQIGEDASTGVDTTAVISRVKAVAMTGHAAVIGAGCSDVQIDDSLFYGGSNASNGQGLVIKNATGVRVTRCDVHGGALSGLYLKACSGVLVEDCNVYNRFSTSAAIRYGINTENNSKASRNIIRECRAYANVGPLFDWSDSTGDAGGSVCDQNVYNVQGSATWGAVRGTTVTDLASVQAAWSGYDRPYNDRNSRVGLTALRQRGDRRIALA